MPQASLPNTGRLDYALAQTVERDQIHLDCIQADDGRRKLLRILEACLGTGAAVTKRNE
jgi:hypothetical protein